MNSSSRLTWTCLRKFDNGDKLAEHSLLVGEQSKQLKLTICPSTDLNWNIFSNCGHGCESDLGTEDEDIFAFYRQCLREVLPFWKNLSIFLPNFPKKKIG